MVTFRVILNLINEVIRSVPRFALDLIAGRSSNWVNVILAIALRQIINEFWRRNPIPEGDVQWLIR